MVWRLASGTQTPIDVALAGEVEGKVSDGHVRVIGPGSIVLLEDTTGKGHRSRVIGSEDAIICMVQLED